MSSMEFGLRKMICLKVYFWKQFFLMKKVSKMLLIFEINFRTFANQIEDYLKINWNKRTKLN